MPIYHVHRVHTFNAIYGDLKEVGIAMFILISVASIIRIVCALSWELVVHVDARLKEKVNESSNWS